MTLARLVVSKERDEMNYQYPGPNDQFSSNPNQPPFNPNQPPFVANNFDANPGEPSSDEKLWAILAHLGMLIGTVSSAGLVGWLIPLVIYLVYKDKSLFVRNAAAGSLNFAIVMFALGLIAAISSFIGVLLSFLIIPLALVLVAILIGIYIYIGGIVFPILAAVKVNNGQNYTYPLTPTIIS